MGNNNALCLFDFFFLLSFPLKEFVNADANTYAWGSVCGCECTAHCPLSRIKVSLLLLRAANATSNRRIKIISMVHQQHQEEEEETAYRYSLEVVWNAQQSMCSVHCSEKCNIHIICCSVVLLYLQKPNALQKQTFLAIELHNVEWQGSMKCNIYKHR